MANYIRDAFRYLHSGRFPPTHIAGDFCVHASRRDVESLYPWFGTNGAALACMTRYSPDPRVREAADEIVEDAQTEGCLNAVTISGLQSTRRYVQNMAQVRSNRRVLATAGAER